MASLLIIDDDEPLCLMLKELLEGEQHQVLTAHQGTDGLEKLRVPGFQLVILDVMLPGLNGIDVLKKIRESSDIPVLMLTAKGDDIDRIIGLELGADDYLAKPFNPRELLARIRAILRRSRDPEFQPLKSESGHIHIDDLQVDFGERTVAISDRVVSITNVEFEILWLLASDAGNVVAREDISEKVFDRSLQIFDRSIDVHISSLRRKIGTRKDGSQRIKTVRGVGYLFAKTSKG